MSTRHALAVCLMLLFLLASCAPAAMAGDTASLEEDGTALLYLHGKRRCRTCRGIEAAADEALRAGFAKALGSGELRFASVDYDQPENRHFLKDFSLASGGLVLAEFEGGAIKRFKVLDQTWPLAHQEQRLRVYVATETRDFLGDAS